MEGHVMEPETPKSPLTVYAEGSFGCPKSKADYGFPASAEENDDDNTQQMLTLALAALAFGMSLRQLMLKRKK